MPGPGGSHREGDPSQLPSQGMRSDTCHPERENCWHGQQQGEDCEAHHAAKDAERTSFGAYNEADSGEEADRTAKNYLYYGPEAGQLIGAWCRYRWRARARSRPGLPRFQRAPEAVSG